MAKGSRKNRTEFYVDDAGEYRWSRLAPNGEVICDSAEGFKKPAGVWNNVVSNGHHGDRLIVVKLAAVGHRRNAAERLEKFLAGKHIAFDPVESRSLQ